MSKDWRDKYLKLADEHEAQGAAHGEAERGFTRLITRLCVAASGLDPLLDPHLKRLRKAAKTGSSDKLLHQAAEVSEALVTAAEERKHPSVLQLLLDRGTPGRPQSDEVLNLWATVAADPGSASDRQLDRLTGLLQAGLSQAEKSNTGGGLWGRLVGKGTAEQPPNRLLLDVLQAVSWPSSLLGEVDAFRDQLAADHKGDAWVGVVRKISDLAVRAMQQAQDEARSAESFLTQLNQRLEVFDRHMLGEAQRHQDSRESGERLGRNMRSEVASLSDSVRQSADLAELQSNVLGGVDRMQVHVRTHLEEENARRAQAEDEAGELRSQLRRLEQDTFDLRRQVAQAYQDAMLDPLTQLPNRRAYDERIAQEFMRWKRFAEPLALLILDVDDFKVVNDTYGHNSGDKALSMIGAILVDRLRETDFIARYGGEEFVVLLSGADQENARRLADDLRAAVESGGLHANRQPVRITVSVGLATFADGDAPGQVFERADRALYAAKQQGKNRVVVG